MCWADAPAVRIGIATGLVVVGDLIGQGTEEHDSAVGETPNLAARLQALAPPNGVVIAVVDAFLAEGKVRLRGSRKPCVEGSIRRGPGLARRSAVPRGNPLCRAAMGSKLTPLVNREEEIALLLVRWQQAKEGDGQVVLLSGEPGIGKSRIVQEIRDRIANEPHACPFNALPITPARRFTRSSSSSSRARLRRGRFVRLSLRRLENDLLAAMAIVRTGVALIRGVVVDSDRTVPPLDLSPQQQKDETVAALVNHFFSGCARDAPLVMIFEDAHWIDPTSREVLDLLVDRVQDTSVLIAITCRSEFQPSWNCAFPHHDAHAEPAEPPVARDARRTCRRRRSFPTRSSRRSSSRRTGCRCSLRS